MFKYTKAITHYKENLLNIKNDLSLLDKNSTNFTEKYLKNLLNNNLQNNAFYDAINSVNTITDTFTNKKLSKLVKNILIEPIQESFRMIVNKFTKEMEKKWDKNVWQNYKKTIAGKFPFCYSDQNLDILDAQDFFSRKGILWEFFNANLSPFLQLKNNRFVPKKIFGVKFNFSKTFLKTINYS